VGSDNFVRYLDTAVACRNDHQKAEEIFQEIKRRRLQIDPWGYNNYLFSCKENMPKMLATLQEMKKSGVKPNSVTYCLLLRRCCRMRDEQALRVLLDEIREQGIELALLSFVKAREVGPALAWAQYLLEESSEDIPREFLFAVLQQVCRCFQKNGEEDKVIDLLLSADFRVVDELFQTGFKKNHLQWITEGV